MTNRRHILGMKVIAILMAVAMIPTLVPAISWAAPNTDAGEQMQQEKQVDETEPAAAEENHAQPKEETEAAPSSDDSDSSDREKAEPAPAQIPDETEPGDGSSQAAGEESEPAAPQTEKGPSAGEKITETDDPAQDFEKTAGGVTVRIHAPKGALPQGTSMHVRSVSAGSVQDDVQDIMGDSARAVKALDISFTKDGREIEPADERSLSVRFSSDQFRDLSGAGVIHIKDSGAAEKIASRSNGAQLTFHAEEFSVYVVTAEQKTLTVRFYDAGGSLISTEWVRQDRNGELTGLYSPGLELKAGESFLGWSLPKGSAKGLTIEELTEELRSRWDSFASEETLDYYAAIGKAFVVRYLRTDSDGDLTVLKTTSVSQEQPARTISVGEGAGAQTGEDFQGWLGQDGVLYQPGAQFPVDRDFVFYAKEAGHNWLVFDSNTTGSGSSADYTPPQLISGQDEVTRKPADPVRSGYRFTGWNTRADGQGTVWLKVSYDAEGGASYESSRFGAVLDSDVTLYAQWEGDQTNYYVLYWQQDAGDEAGLPDDQKTYNYVGSRSEEARTGDVVHTTGADRNMTAAEGYPHYRYNAAKSDTSASVNADGTTTLNVYYDLEEYTLTFQARDDNGDAASWKTIRQVHAVAGHNISDIWPITGTDGKTYDSGERWNPQSNSVGLSQVLVYLDVMPAGDVTFRLDTSDKITKHIHYYVEALPDESLPVRSYNGTDFVLYKNVDARYGYFTEAEDYLDFVGFSKSSKYPPEAFNGSVRANYPWGSGSDATDIYCYYTRDKNELRFVSISSGRQETVEEVQYGQKLSRFADYRPTNGADGAVFTGWYTDPTCAKGTEFRFRSTMPAKDLTLYAGWIDQRCRVVLDPGAPEGSYSFGDSQELTFCVNYNEKISDTNITAAAAQRPGYELEGWYTEDGDLWNFDTQVNEKSPGVNPEYQTTEDWKNNTYGDSDGAHGNVKNILKLRAHWRLNVAEDSVYVLYRVAEPQLSYDADGKLRTIVPVDAAPHAPGDKAGSVTFRAGPAPGRYDSKYIFKDWALLNADGSRSAVTFADGAQAEVDPKYIQTRTLSDDTAGAQMRCVVLEAEFTTDRNRAAAVIFDGNGGATADDRTEISQSVSINRILLIPAEDAFTRDGYTFKGWNAASDGSGTAFEPGSAVAADNLDGDAWNAEDQTNRIYAQWEKDASAAVITGPSEGNAEPVQETAEETEPAAPSPQAPASAYLKKRSAEDSRSTKLAAMLPGSSKDNDSPVGTARSLLQGSGSGLQDLADDPLPLAIIDGEWTLLNLVFTVATAVISILLLGFYFIKKREDEDEGLEELSRANLIVRLLGVIPAVVAIMTFSLTEDLTMDMGLVDKHTLPSILILAVEAFIALVAARTAAEEERRRARRW
ncbi:MAG: InlB B-repeat-containing protein [Firmicutes bacterium]|nr:InlB B-repeat-containing protein [Bacillota bacterium]